ncbi:MAG: SDR family oxidoreductase [Methanomicrobiales archaeon]|nr:SDR family oxidoreductase [Methanomicrobiales archaeon]
MKYLITGGAGFIGSHLVEALAQTHEVVILDDLSSGKTENIRALEGSNRATFVRGSIRDLPLLNEILKGVDGVFHQAAVTSVPRSVADPARTNETNIGGTLNILIAARDGGVRKVVFASSSSVYGDTPTLPKREDMIPHPQSPYAVSKITGEYYCQVFSRLYGLPTVCLRYFNVFGPRQDPQSDYAAVIPKFITRMLQGAPPIIYGDGLQTRDFTYVRDVVQANMQAMNGDAVGIYNIACGARINLLDLASIIREEVRSSVTPVFQPSRPGDVRDSLADISAAQEALGYRPRFTLQSGLRETIAWYRKQKGE